MLTRLRTPEEALRAQPLAGPPVAPGNSLAAIRAQGESLLDAADAVQCGDAYRIVIRSTGGCCPFDGVPVGEGGGGIVTDDDDVNRGGHGE